MTQRTRKFIGVWLLLGVLIAYPLAIAVIYATYFSSMHPMLALAIFVVLGLLWAVPAGYIIKWMVKPDAPASE